MAEGWYLSNGQGHLQRIDELCATDLVRSLGCRSPNEVKGVSVNCSRKGMYCVFFAESGRRYSQPMVVHVEEARRDTEGVLATQGFRKCEKQLSGTWWTMAAAMDAGNELARMQI